MLEYEEHTTDNDQHTVRFVDYRCENPACEDCQREGNLAYAIIVNSVTFDQNRWLATGLCNDNEKEKIIESWEDQRYADYYARLSAIFGIEWGVYEKDLHMALDLSRDRLLPFLGEQKFNTVITGLNPKYVQVFQVPETEAARQAVDRIKTLLAFPQLYKPKKGKGKKADPKKPYNQEQDTN